MVAALKAGRQWSPAQQDIFEAVSKPGPHLVIEALAGTGKTTTIIEALSHIDDSASVLMMAFNKSIASELLTRVPDGVEAMTFHSFGLKAVSKAMPGRKINGYHVSDQLRGIIPSGEGSREARSAVAKLVGIAKGCLLESHDELDAAADRYGIDFPKGWDRDRLIRAARMIMQSELQDSHGPIDFDDMVWLPVVKGLRVPRYDWVFVDETQDLNRAQLELAIRAAGDHGRIVAVGDRRQAIYGFRGADQGAIPRMIERLGAQILPLNVTYRCPRSVVAQAQVLVPDLEAAPGAPEGIVRDSTVNDLEANAAPGDFVISRTNAQLIRLCYKWIRSGRKATIRGRDIGAGLAAWVKGTHATTIDQLEACLRSWHSGEVARLAKKDRPTEAADDKAECLEALIEGCREVAEVLAKIEALFGDLDDDGAILLTSTHRAKGLEADRVWLLRDTYCRWPGDEEQNLLYVGITRSKRELIYVRENDG